MLVSREFYTLSDLRVTPKQMDEKLGTTELILEPAYAFLSLPAHFIQVTNPAS
jgi:hypothetical protein